MHKVMTIGEVLVEIMAEEVGEGFTSPISLVGPFPSGAPAIFIDQVAKLGVLSGIIACVGDDDFGRVNRQRLADDGVDISGIEVAAGHPTGTAFVRYRADGQRDFIFNIRHSASAQLTSHKTALDVLGACSHLHVSGASMFSKPVTDMIIECVKRVRDNGGSISFDPNIRKEILREPRLKEGLNWVLDHCDTYLPSGDELTVLTSASSREEAVKEILGRGVSTIVVKEGPEGATYYGDEGTQRSDAFPVEEMDPTGAGDCFDATFVACRLLGRDVGQSLAYANASGARAVTVRGPMEGTSSFSQLDELRSSSGSSRGRRLNRFVPQREGAKGYRAGITSVCSAHPVVVEAALRNGAASGTTVLIEATCNQVNHQGGYTGLTPGAFRNLVYEVADRVGCPRRQVLLGGDHLGPNPWRHLDPGAAMGHAVEMVNAYVSAGFEKVHLDTSMGCDGEPVHLADAVTAERAARLAVVAESAAITRGSSLHYVIGTEVPVPGGAVHEIEQLEVTRAEAVVATVEAHRRAFEQAGVEEAFQRVVAVVVQPGVEFDDRSVVVYRPERATGLTGSLSGMPGVVYEAHSTDYQPAEALAHLVRDGFAILKVGPGLTFALREALYGLDQIAMATSPGWASESLMAEMEEQMVADPSYWRPYYHGDAPRLRTLRHYSYSDRIRYYWSTPRSQAAVERLWTHLTATGIPEPLISQFLPKLYDRVTSGVLAPTPSSLAMEAVTDVLRMYDQATGQDLEKL